MSIIFRFVLIHFVPARIMEIPVSNTTLILILIKVILIKWKPFKSIGTSHH